MATTAKKTTAKKPVAKKAAAKRPVKKIAAAPVAAPVATAKTECGCAQGCACGGKCACKRGGFWHFVKKLIVFVIIFALGFAAAKICCTGKPMHRGPRVAFVNGCMDVTKVKCPEMLANLQVMDINGDGCISREEYKEFKKSMHK